MILARTLAYLQRTLSSIMPSSEKRVACVTGASSGIGRATALEFARHNFHLSLSGRDEKALEAVVAECKKAGAAEVITTIGDLREEKNAKALVENTTTKFGQLDTLINSAGVLLTGEVIDAKIDDYDTLFAVNVRSVIQLTRLALPAIIKRKGTVVNVSSVAGVSSFPGATYYCMTKAALDQFTKCLALEMAPHGVRVNAVNPGVIVTDIHRRAGMDDASYKQFLEKSKQTHALGRAGTADEVARGIHFLASDASSFTTGLLLLQDGGRSLMTPR